MPSGQKHLNPSALPRWALERHGFPAEKLTTRPKVVETTGWLLTSTEVNEETKKATVAVISPRNIQLWSEFDHSNADKRKALKEIEFCCFQDVEIINQSSKRKIHILYGFSLELERDQVCLREFHTQTFDPCPFPCIHSRICVDWKTRQAHRRFRLETRVVFLTEYSAYVTEINHGDEGTKLLVMIPMMTS